MLEDKILIKYQSEFVEETQKVYEQAYEQAYEQGEEQKAIEVAQKLLLKGIEDTIVAESTSLPMKKIRELKI